MNSSIGKPGLPPTNLMHITLPILLCFGAFFMSAVNGYCQEEKYDQVPWHTPRVSFVPQQRQLKDLLKDFAVSQHLPLLISDSVKGVISGTFMDVETEQFLNTLCEAHDLVWFYDGVRMNVESTEEVISRPLSLTYVTPDTINDVIFSIGFASGPKGREVQVKQGHRSGVILLVGGPQFVQASEALARDLEIQEGKRLNEQITVNIFRLNYATAGDLTTSTGSTNTVIPGVVRALQNLMLNQAPGSSLSTGNEVTSNRLSHQGLMGQGLAAVGNPNPNQQRGYNAFAADGGQEQRTSSGQVPSDRSPQADPSDPRSPMIVADVRLNAVLVRDVASRMPLYEELIKMLDVQTKAIEISAAIVDIDANNARDLGIELLGFGKNNKHSSGRVGFDADRGLFDGANSQGQIPSFIDGTNLARGVGFNLTTLFQGNGYDLLTRLRAIERAGAGQVLSSPSVFTLENVQAVMRTEEKVYVRIQGNMATDLFDVSTGVQLRVTPTLVNTNDKPQFKLIIDITDGSFSDTKVDSIPATRESAINTQAMVPNGKTLLLGGYTVERRTTSDSSVPFLNKIPGIRKLLSRTEREHERRQRFFFITPRLVDLDKESTTPANYLDGFNDMEINARLPEEDLTRETPEELARRLASSSTRLPNLYGPRDVDPPTVVPDVDTAQPAINRESFNNRLFKSDIKPSTPPQTPGAQLNPRKPLFEKWFKKS